MEWKEVIFHCLVLQKMNGMEWSVMELYSTLLTHFSFPPNWSVSNEMKLINNKITTLSSKISILLTVYILHSSFHVMLFYSFIVTLPLPRPSSSSTLTRYVIFLLIFLPIYMCVLLIYFHVHEHFNF